jgi:hypothetical protein
VIDADKDSAAARSFGEELRRERELRQISLREVAEATKINLRFLEALENNDFDTLPGGFFVRGFIKAFARHIGVNEEAMVNAYLLELGRQRGRAAASADPTPPPASEPPPPKAPASAATGSAARGSVLPGASSGAARAVIVGASLLAFLGVAFLLWSTVRQMGAGAARAPEAAPTAGPASGAEEVAAAAPAGLREPPPPTLSVELGVRRRSWVRVLCDGSELVNRTLDGGARRSFECRDEVSLSASEAQALEVRINGRALELPGSPGERLTPFLVRRLEWPPAAAQPAAQEAP